MLSASAILRFNRKSASNAQSKNFMLICKRVFNNVCTTACTVKGGGRSGNELETI